MSEQYSLVPGDLREFDGLAAALQSAGLQHDLPTLVLAECVLVYLPQQDSQKIISCLGAMLPNAAFVVYEQVFTTYSPQIQSCAADPGPGLWALNVHKFIVAAIYQAQYFSNIGASKCWKFHTQKNQ